MPSVEPMKNKKKPVVRALEGGVKRSALREDCYRILSEDNCVDPKKEISLGKDQMLKMYRNMVLTRLFDERAMILQRQGRIGFHVPSFGQEAIQTGSAAALDDGDWVFPSYREPGIFIYRGASLYQMICNLYGNKEDVCKGRQMPVHYSFAKLKLFSISSPIATQIIQAVGAAMAFKIRKEEQISVAFFGDGATSENDFHTGLTFAGSFKAPTVFVCTNNQYAISVPVSKQTGAARLADKALGYGMPGIAVDGNDIFAVYTAVKEAVEKARNGGGPSLIECLTLRMGPHSSSDDPTRYRDEKLFELWRKRDPIVRFREFLVNRKYWDEKRENQLVDTLKKELMETIEKAEKQGPPSLESIFDDVFQKRTPRLEEQLAALLEEQALRGKFENNSEAFPL